MVLDGKRKDKIRNDIKILLENIILQTNPRNTKEAK